MCMFYRLYGWLSSLALFFIWSTSKLLQSHFKQTLIYFEVTLIMPVMSFFKENITPPESNSSAEISILFWHFSRFYRYFSRNVSFCSEQCTALFRIIQPIVPNNANTPMILFRKIPFLFRKLSNRLWHLAENFDISPETIDFSLEILTFRSKSSTFRSN